MGAEMSRKGRQSRGPCLELLEAGALRLPWEQEREMVRVGEKASRQFQPQDGTRPGDRPEVLLGRGTHSWRALLHARHSSKLFLH